MDSEPTQEPQNIPPDVLKISNGFNHLLSAKTGRRVDSTDPWGHPITNIDIVEKGTIVTNGPVAHGVRLEAGYVYADDGSIDESFANIYDRNTGFHIELPLNPITGEIDTESVAEWDEPTRQKVHVIMGRLLTVAFSTTKK